MFLIFINDKYLKVTKYILITNDFYAYYFTANEIIVCKTESS